MRWGMCTSDSVLTHPSALRLRRCMPGYAGCKRQRQRMSVHLIFRCIAGNPAQATMSHVSPARAGEPKRVQAKALGLEDVDIALLAPELMHHSPNMLQVHSAMWVDSEQHSTTCEAINEVEGLRRWCYATQDC